MENDKKIEMMKNEKIPKVLLKLGLPTMIGMLVSALYSIVDTYFAGWLGTSEMGAVAVTFPIVQVIIGLGMMFGSGAASYISRLFGEGKRDEADKTASTALLISVVVGVLSIVIALCIMEKLLIALGATSGILDYAKQYAYIYVAGSILNIVNVTMNNIITSEGKAKFTMVSMLIGGGLNIILDPLFMITANMGIRGAAIATVVSQTVTTCFYIWFIASKKSALKFSFKNISFKKNTIIQILKIGFPLLVFQLLSSLALSLTNNAAGEYGDSAVAAVGAAVRVLTIGTYVVFGFLKGFQPVVGYNYGIKNYTRVNKAITTSLIWCTAFCSIAALLLIFIPDKIMLLFSKTDTQLIEIGTKYLRANGYLLFFFGFQMVYMSVFLALGKGAAGGLLSISRQGLFFIPAILVLPTYLGLEGIIWAQPLADVISVMLTTVFAVSIHVKLNKEAKEALYGNN